MINQIYTAKEITRSHGSVSEELIKFSAQIAAVLAVPMIDLVKIYEELARSPKLPTVWLEFYYCAGEAESFFSALEKSDPRRQSSSEEGNIDWPGMKLLMNHLSVEYHASLKNPIEPTAVTPLEEIVNHYSGQYLCIIEGAIPNNITSVRDTIHGSNLASMLENVTSHAKATIAVGSCAVDGNLTSINGKLFRSTGLRETIPGIQSLLNLPGCPAEMINAAAAIVYLITYGELPPSDRDRRPLFAYGSENRAFIEQMEFYKSKKISPVRSIGLNRDCWCGYQLG